MSTFALSRTINGREVRSLREMVTHYRELGGKTGIARPEPEDVFGFIVGNGKLRDTLMREIAIVGVSTYPVLITGESGTGKEVAAEAIHLLSSTYSGQFVPINCAAIPTELAESEFFGHTKGSFTGAHADKKGLFESANGGTLFLDEFGELPAIIQVKLLRAMQDGIISRVGSERSVKVNVRLVAATNRDIEKTVADGGLREDLVHRITVHRIRLSPLRERKSDIPILAQYFLDKFNAHHNTNVAIEEDALAFLSKIHFPGNIRQLEHLIQNAGCRAIYAKTPITITTIYEAVVNINGGMRIAEPSQEQVMFIEDIRSRPVGTLKLDDIEREAVLRAFELCRGHKDRTAAMLGITAKTLYNKLQKYKVEGIVIPSIPDET